MQRNLLVLPTPSGIEKHPASTWIMGVGGIAGLAFGGPPLPSPLEWLSVGPFPLWAYMKRSLGEKAGSTAVSTGTCPHAEGPQWCHGWGGKKVSSCQRRRLASSNAVARLSSSKTGDENGFAVTAGVQLPQTSDPEGPVGSGAHCRGPWLNSAGNAQAGPGPARPKSHEGHYPRPVPLGSVSHGSFWRGAGGVLLRQTRSWGARPQPLGSGAASCWPSWRPLFPAFAPPPPASLSLAGSVVQSLTGNLV